MLYRGIPFSAEHQQEKDIKFEFAELKEVPAVLSAGSAGAAAGSFLRAGTPCVWVLPEMGVGQK